MSAAETKRRWRDYRTAAGRRPVKEFIDELSDVDAAAVVAAMYDVRNEGLNRRRRHSALGMRTPIEFELINTTTTPAAA